MSKSPRKKWRTADAHPVAYWLVGALLLWSILPAYTLDLLLAPDWFAPHWQCDSIGIPIAQFYISALPYAAISLVASGCFVVISTRNRQGGADIFNLRPDGSLWSWGTTLVAGVWIGAFLLDFLRYLVEVLFLQSWVSDCNGTADPIEVSMRRPALQMLPWVGIVMIYWVLHMRAYAVSPKRKPPQ